MGIGFRNIKQALIIFLSLLLLYIIISIPIFIVRTNNVFSIVSTNMKTDISAYTSSIDNQVSNVATNLLVMENLIKNRDIFMKNIQLNLVSEKQSKLTQRFLMITHTMYF